MRRASSPHLATPASAPPSLPRRIFHILPRSVFRVRLNILRWSVLWAGSGCSTVLDTEAHTLGDLRSPRVRCASPVVSRCRSTSPFQRVSLAPGTEQRYAFLSPSPSLIRSRSSVTRLTRLSILPPPPFLPHPSNAVPCASVSTRSGWSVCGLAAAVAPSSIPRRTHSGICVVLV
jgi:hypothetical protein